MAKQTPGADARAIKLAADIIGTRNAIRQIERRIDATQDNSRRAALDKEISDIVDRCWEWRRELARVRTTTMDGFEAKAAVVREFADCGRDCDPSNDEAVS